MVGLVGRGGGGERVYRLMVPRRRTFGLAI